MSRIRVAARGILFLLVCGALPSAQEAPTPEAHSRAVYHVSPTVDLYQYARHLQRVPLEAPEYLEPALDPLREIQSMLGRSLLAWGTLDALVATCSNAKGIAVAFEALPPSIETSEGSVDVRDAAFALAEALAQAEGRFLVETWPDHRATIEAARLRLEQELDPRLGECLGHLTEALGIDDPAIDLPVFLVHSAAWPGAMTWHHPDGGGVVFLGVTQHTDSLLFETLLHEATHALEIQATEGHGLDRLREGLVARGVPDGEQILNDLPHALMFVQAGETVRRVLDPEHVHYGEATGLYERLPMAKDLRELWEARLEGDYGLDEAIGRILDRASELGLAPLPSR